MKRILIISPHFPPSNAADHQRVRLLLPHFAGCGWQAELLAVDPCDVAAPTDDWSATGLPAEVPVHRVRALGLGWSRIPGLGTLTFRALGALRRRGDELLRARRFDLVYFSTTQFGVHVLGPRWQQKFNVPFVMDYQDPWVSDYYRTHPEVSPPGGRLKYAVVDWLNRRQEPRVLRQCAGITSVSPDYPRQLQARYPWLDFEILKAEIPKSETLPGSQRSILKFQRLSVAALESSLSASQGLSIPAFNKSAPPSVLPAPRSALPSLILPFPGDPRDFERVKSERVGQQVFDPQDGKLHWVYVGRGGADMALACRGIFAAIRSEVGQNPGFISRLRLHFIGTSYARAGQGARTIAPLAAEFGLSDLVHEHPDRIPYAQTLRCLLDADALIVPGSDDPGYTASKIYPYLLARKPLLTVFHENSSVVALLRKVGGGCCVSFQSEEAPEVVAARIHDLWFRNEAWREIVPLDEVAFGPYTAEHSARTLTEFFEICLSAHGRHN